MIKNIYHQEHKHYMHKYICDDCLKYISNDSKIYRNELAIKCEIFDICEFCIKKWDKPTEIKTNPLTRFAFVGKPEKIKTELSPELKNAIKELLIEYGVLKDDTKR